MEHTRFARNKGGTPPPAANAWHASLDLWLILAWYAGAYAFYRLKLGLGFSLSVMSDMHFLAPDALQGDLLRSLLYLHAQPPLMNLVAGLAYKLKPYTSIALEIFYFIAGVAAISLFYHAMRLAGVSRISRLLGCLALCSFPTLFLYQTWVYSTHLEFCLASAALYFLAACYATPERRTGMLAGLFLSGCLLGLMHAQWNIIVFAGLSALMCLLDRRQLRRIALMATLCLLPLAGWYTKNLVMFGFWGSSSWLGANMAQLAEIVGRSDLSALKAQHRISPDFPAVYNIRKIIDRAPPEHLPPTDVPALQPYKYMNWPNYNYSGVIISSQQDWRDAMTILADHPWQYLRIVDYRLRDLLWRPSSSYPFMPGMDSMVRHAGYSIAPGKGYSTLPAALRKSLQWMAFLLYGCAPLALGSLTLLGRPAGLGTAFPNRRKFIACALYLMAIMLVIPCAFSAFEQERMRWGMGSFYLLCAAMLLDAAIALLRQFDAAVRGALTQYCWLSTEVKQIDDVRKP